MKLYLLIFSFVLLTLNGQTINSPNFSIKSSPFEVVEYGTSSHNVYYKVSFLENARTLESKKEVLCILQIGDKVSKFFDYNQIKKDSLIKKYSTLATLGSKEINELLKIPILWNNIILKKNDTIIIQDRYKNVYQYEEEKSKLNWILEKGEKEIIGYNCKKARVHYRGRTYNAWYTTEIPINNGPYIFEGLPGLILEIEDNDKKYSFIAVGINKKAKPIYLRREKNIFKTSREKFRNVQKTFYENPGAFFSGKAYNEDGTPIIIKQNNIQYEPIEIE